MPKLPDKNALGGAPSFRTGRAMVSGASLGLDAVPRAVEKAGVTLAAFGEAEQKEADALDLIKADAAHKTRLMETQRGFDTDPDYQTYGERYDTAAIGATEEAASLIRSKSLRDKWVARAQLSNEQVRDRVLDRGTQLARQHKAIEVEDALKLRRSGYIDPSLDDAARERALADMDDYITAAERTGLLLPNTAHTLREGYIEGAIVDDAEQRLWTDPDGLLRDLQMPGGARGPSSGRTSDTGLEFIRRQEGFAPKAKWDFKQYSVGYGTRSRAGEQITKEEAERRLIAETGEVSNWIATNVKAPLSQNQHDALVSFGFNLGTGAIEKLLPDINAGNFDRVAERMLSFNKADGKTMPGLVKRRQEEAMMFASAGEPMQVADASGKEGIEASDLPPPFTHSKYSRLSPNKRAALIFKAKTAQSAVTQQQVRDDLERIRRTGAPELAADGSTSLDRASRFLTPNQVAKLRLEWDEAKMEHDAISPLKTLSELEDESGMSDVDRHFAALAPDEKLPEESYASRARVLDKTVREWKKIQEQRRKDPAMAVNDAPEVRSAFEMVSKRIPDVGIVQDEDGDLDIAAVDGAPAVNAHKAQEIVIEARLAAQRERGIPDVLRSPITRRQAERLLDMPDPSLLDEKTFINKLRSASDRAEQIYGPKYARQAFESAVRFKLREKEHKEAAAGVIAKMVRGEPVSQRDLSRINTLDDISASDGVFSDQFLPQFMDDASRPFISPQFGREALTGIQDFAAREANRNPNQQQIEWLRENPDQWRLFDQKFGRGAAVKVLGGKAEQ